MDDKAIKVLIIEDSRSTGAALARLLNPFTLVGIAKNGQEALRMQARLKPDIITMDIHLPDTNGLDLTRQILSRRKVPIVIISSLVEPERQDLIFEALRSGAYDVISKSRFFATEGKDRATQKLLRLIRAAAATSHRRMQPSAEFLSQREFEEIENRTPVMLPRSALFIGASTGGPPALRTVFGAIPAGFPLPILVAQHMSEGFIEGFVRWLDSQIAIKVTIARDGQQLMPSVAYFPPSGHHMSVTAAGLLRITPAREGELCPSVNLLFESAARVFGSQAICLLLTGMGSDGAQGLLAARNSGALTAAQNKESSVIFGMPREAMRLKAVDHVLSLEDIGSWIVYQATLSVDGRQL